MKHVSRGWAGTVMRVVTAWVWMRVSRKTNIWFAWCHYVSHIPAALYTGCPKIPDHVDIFLMDWDGNCIPLLNLLVLLKYFLGFNMRDEDINFSTIWKWVERKALMFLAVTAYTVLILPYYITNYIQIPLYPVLIFKLYKLLSIHYSSKC